MEYICDNCRNLKEKKPRKTAGGIEYHIYLCAKGHQAPVTNAEWNCKDDYDPIVPQLRG